MILWIWIFFLPMVLVLQWEDQGKVTRCEVTDGCCYFSSSLNLYSLSVCPRCAHWPCLKHPGREAFTSKIEKNKNKKRGRRKKGRTGLCVQHAFQIMVLFLGAGHPHSSWTRIFCPPLHLSWAASGKQHKRHLSGWERQRFWKGQGERGFVCILWPYLATTNPTYTRE